MDKHHNHNNNGSGGFLFGLIIGVALTLLLVTKKGRRILKILTDEGMDKLGDWEGIIKDVKDSLEEDDEDVIEGEDYVVQSTKEPPLRQGFEGQAEETASNATDVMGTEDIQGQTPPSEPSTVSRIKTTTRRFFRRVPKRG